MKILKSKVIKTELIANYNNFFRTVIKAVVDIEGEIIAVDADLHADLETLLIEDGSSQSNLWGINLYPFKGKKSFIEYTALINIRPYQNNFSMEIKDKAIKSKISKIVKKLIEYDS